MKLYSAKGEINLIRKKKVSNTIIRDFLLHVLQTLQGLDFHQKVEIKSSYIVQYHNQILLNKSIEINKLSVFDSKNYQNDKT